ncbi:hypothetical protein [Breznakiella homolactica]|uniref:Uncharacterized protein n=1 Tax=Breznakiella homolactica TaxID=2798577 RepID=A0A7T7XJR8_9SPIR|nr:hypothetical protein [Breznakiella homolactica]QQO07651.1 hypothetical protein JFL75_11915 [Breznakiella homolactica]
MGFLDDIKDKIGTKAEEFKQAYQKAYDETESLAERKERKEREKAEKNASGEGEA